MVDQAPNYKTHTNKEQEVGCPYCDSVVKSRGLYQHVWRSGDDAHGGHKEMPDDWEQTEPEVVGEADVSVHVPTKKEYNQEHLVCKHCGEDFKGTHGLSVHLSRVDDEVHPTDADPETAGLRVPGEFSDENILNVGSSPEDEPDEREAPAGYVPLADVVETIARLEGQGKSEAADELRKTVRPYR